jgi:hypothetical protein
VTDRRPIVNFTKVWSRRSLPSGTVLYLEYHKYSIATLLLRIQPTSLLVNRPNNGCIFVEKADTKSTTAHDTCMKIVYFVGTEVNWETKKNGTMREPMEPSKREQKQNRQSYPVTYAYVPLSSNWTLFRISGLLPAPPTHLHTRSSSPPCTSSKLVLTFALPSTTRST